MEDENHDGVAVSVRVYAKFLASFGRAVSMLPSSSEFAEPFRFWEYLLVFIGLVLLSTVVPGPPVRLVDNYAGRWSIRRALLWVGPDFESLKLGYSRRPMRKVSDGPSPVKLSRFE